MTKKDDIHWTKYHQIAKAARQAHACAVAAGDCIRATERATYQTVLAESAAEDCADAAHEAYMLALDVSAAPPESRAELWHLLDPQLKALDERTQMSLRKARAGERKARRIRRQDRGQS